MEQKTNTISNGQKIILWWLSKKPMTANELCAAIECSRGGVISAIRALKKSGMVYVDGSVITTGRPAPIYHVHKAHPEPKTKKMRYGIDASSRDAVAQAIKEAGPMTAVELAEYIGVRRNRVNATLSHHREYGKSSSVFKIASWVWLDRFGWIAQYGNGPGIDAKKPKPDKQANHQRYREKMKAVARSRNKTFAANPFGELIHMAGATHQVAYWGPKS